MSYKLVRNISRPNRFLFIVLTLFVGCLLKWTIIYVLVMFFVFHILVLTTWHVLQINSFSVERAIHQESGSESKYDQLNHEGNSDVLCEIVRLPI